MEETRYTAHVTMRAHYHHGPTLSVVLRGGYLERFGRRGLEVKPMMAVLKPPQLEHENTIGATGLHALLIELTPEFLHDASLDWPDEPRIVDCALATRRIAHLRQAHDAHHDRSEDEFALIHDLLFDISRESRRGFDPGASPWLEAVRERLHDEFPVAPSLASLASAAGVHPVHLAQRFRRRYGLTIGEYVRRLRVEHAVRALRGAYPLSRVALDAGFADQSHLTRVFRQFIGVTPARFRSLVT